MTLDQIIPDGYVGKFKHENIEFFIDGLNEESVFVEIGGDRGEGSTLYLADLATKYNNKFLCIDLDKNFLQRTFEPYRIKPKVWQEDVFFKSFVDKVKDDSWPTASSLDELPDSIRHEIINDHNYFYYRDLLKDSFELNLPDIPKHQSDYTMQNHPNLDFFCAEGSKWAAQYSGPDIAVLYLDNFDYMWNNQQEKFLDFQEFYKEHWNLTMTNENCQIEHLRQTISLLPFITKNGIIACDDTFQIDGCWVGKCGPAVIYLLANGYNIVYSRNNFVILKNN